MRPDGLVFDLDGTLWDTTEACALAWNRVARELGIIGRLVTAEDMHRVTGLPHTEAVRRVFKGLPEAQVETISARSQVEDNRVVAETGGTLYSGVADNVPVLSGRLPLYIVSNCQSGYVEIFLRTSGLGAHFSDFECWGNTGQSKSENLRMLIARQGLRAPWFIGDTEGDCTAARDNGVYFVHAA